MNLYDIVAAGPILHIDRESGILASYADGRVHIWEYAGMERSAAGSFDKAGLVPTYNLVRTWYYDGETDLNSTELLNTAKEFAMR